MTSAPTTDIDMFTDDARPTPCPRHAELRGLGPAFAAATPRIRSRRQCRTDRSTGSAAAYAPLTASRKVSGSSRSSSSGSPLEA